MVKMSYKNSGRHLLGVTPPRGTGGVPRCVLGAPRGVWVFPGDLGMTPGRMAVPPGGPWMSLRVSGCPEGSLGCSQRGLRVPLRGRWGCPQGGFWVPPRVSGALLVGLILLTSLPDLQESRRGLGGAQEIFWGYQGTFKGCQETFWGYHHPPAAPHLDVGLRQGDHLGQDVGHLQVLQLIPLPCALPEPGRGRGDSGGSPRAPKSPEEGTLTWCRTWMR